jgi:microcystin degradation protein MlrC
MRIAVASFSHETCTFCPKLTSVDDFEAGGVHYGQDVLDSSRGIPNYINGFIKAATEYKDVELIGILSASRSRGGSSGSWLTKECFDKYSNGISEGIKQSGKIDGVLLALHGAMATKEFPKPEAEVVRKVRSIVGPDVPIMVTLDLHANEDYELTDAAEGVFILKTYPHVDSEEIGYEAATCLIRTLKGVFKPTMAIAKPGVLTPSVYQWTGESPGKDIMDKARKWEEEPDCYSVSVAFGFAYADVPDAGATVIAVTNNNFELAEKIVKDISEFIWDVRESFAGKTLPKTEEGVKKAIKLAESGRIPVIIADHSDRTGDGTHILEELKRQDADNFCIATLTDERAIKMIQNKANVGDLITISVGGYASCWSGKPVELTGIVEYLDECEYVLNGPMNKGATKKMGTVVLLAFGNNNHVIITSTLHQVLDDAIFPALGLRIKDIDIVALKSRVHFRAFYDKAAGSIVVIDAPGLGPADLTQHNYQNLPENIYPIGKKWQQ